MRTQRILLGDCLDVLSDQHDVRAIVADHRFGPDECVSVTPPPDWWVHNPDLKAPFPWFGGKSMAAELIWDRFGDVENYIEPFAGSLAVLLARQLPAKYETVNDIDGHLVNFWRAVQYDPEAVARWADWPVHELEMHAWHKKLVKLIPYVRARLDSDPQWFHPVLAGRWVWGLSAWIGGGWCGHKGITRGAHQLPKLSTSSSPNGVHRASLRTHWRLPKLAPHALNGVHAGERRDNLIELFESLSRRLRYVRAACGDFERVLSESITLGHTPCAVLLDPPYPAEHGNNRHIYTEKDDLDVFDRAFRYACANGHDKRLRIAFCYYEGNTAKLDNDEIVDVSAHLADRGWDIVLWKAGSGYRRGEKHADNAARERIAFSPHSLSPQQGSLF